MIKFLLIALLISHSNFLSASDKTETLSAELSPSTEVDSSYVLNYSTPKKDTTLKGRGSYWSARLVSFYLDHEFIGSYMAFDGPVTHFPKSRKIIVPSQIEEYEVIVVEEHFWRMTTLLTGTDPKSFEKKAGDIWTSKSSNFPLTRAERRKGILYGAPFLTYIQSLPDYTPWLSRHIAGGVWSGKLNVEYHNP